MQAVILAAGESLRFWPLNSGHKSEFKIFGKQIIYWTIKNLVDVGIKDIIIICSPNSLLKQEIDGVKELDCKITYVVQEKPIGSGDALFQAKNFIKESFILLHPNKANVKDLLKQALKKFNDQKPELVLCGEKTQTPWEYGVYKFEEGKVVEIIENPIKGKEPSSTKNLGIYILTPTFFHYYENIERHEEDDLIKVLNIILKEKKTEVIILEKEIATLKYPWDSLTLLAEMFNSDNFKEYIAPSAKIKENVLIKGKVYIGENVQIDENTVINGPCYIGDNSHIGFNNLLRGPVNLENNTLTGAFCEIKNSIVQENTHFHSGFIGDSIIGKNCRFGAGVITANRRIDRENIKVKVKDKRIDSGKSYLGVAIGDNTRVGVRSITMPGVLIGANCTIGPATTVSSNIPNNTIYYTKSQEVISKTKLQKIIIFDLDHTLFDTEEYKKTSLKTFKLFNDAKSCLDDVSKFAKLLIFSEGNIALQKQKIKETNLNKYFNQEDIYFFDSFKKMENFSRILEKYPDSIFYYVENKQNYLRDAKQLNPEVFTIWINREKIEELIDGFTPDMTINSLNDILPIIK